MNIVVTNLKGGVGKTTSTVYLAAVAAARGHGPVVLVDADRQASAAEWLEERPIEGVEVLEAPSERTLARAMRADEGTVVVDLPPGDERLVQAAIGAADTRYSCDTYALQRMRLRRCARDVLLVWFSA